MSLVPQQIPMELLEQEEYGESGNVTILVDRANEKVWVTQKQIAELLSITVPTVNVHIKRIKAERGDSVNATIRKLLIVANDGKQREVEHYDMTIVNLIGSRAHHSAEVAAFQDWVGQQLNRTVSAKPKANRPFEATKRYRELRASGLTHEEAMDRRDVDLIGVEAHKRAVAEWFQRKGDIAHLTNHTTRLVTGKSATALKRHLKIKVSPRAYISSLERGALSIVEDFGAILHRRRNSQGTAELARDLDDASQVIDHERLNAMLNDKPILPPPPKPQQRPLLPGRGR